MKAKLFFSLLALIGITALSACGDGAGDNAEGGTPEMGQTGNPTIDGLTQAISANSGNPDLYVKRGDVFYENRGYDEAIRDYTKAIQLDTTQPVYYHKLADAYLDYFKSRQALEILKSAAQRFPEDIPTLLKLSEYHLILMQYEESMKTIDRVLKIDPQNAEAYFMFGMNFEERKDTVRAINSYQEAVELDASIIGGWVNLGQLYAGLGDPLALRYFDNATRIAPNNITALHSKADYLTATNDLEGAVALYRRIITIDPQYDDAYFNSGLLYLDMDSLSKAEQQFDLAVKVSPTHIRAYYFRGLSRELQGKPAEAVSDYEQALRMAPDYEQAQERLNGLKEAG
ncbi:MAG: tetratricopeptide repeat protein [Phaeodactylibacter sp.]|uniref:tetratricopeptide repeat protein n=1 Tax=Phaeodactylibacter sp. TaxID=1940289 RepID=UPI0032ED67DA